MRSSSPSSAGRASKIFRRADRLFHGALTGCQIVNGKPPVSSVTRGGWKANPANPAAAAPRHLFKACVYAMYFTRRCHTPLMPARHVVGTQERNRAHDLAETRSYLW